MSVKHAQFDTASVAGNTLTGTYANILNPSDDFDALIIMSDLDVPWWLKFSDGTAVRFPGRVSLTIDARTNARRIKRSSTLQFQVKHDGVAPASGTVLTLLGMR